MTKADIIARAKEFCEEHKISSYPVNIISICEECGFKVFEEKLPENVSGFILTISKERHEDSYEKFFARYKTDKIIVINIDDSAKRKRFTIAHELAHYILHSNGDELYAHRDAGQNGGIETEANIFASNILMPEDLVNEALEWFDGFYLENISFSDKVIYISKEFAVSISAAQTRLSQLIAS